MLSQRVWTMVVGLMLLAVGMNLAQKPPDLPVINPALAKALTASPDLGAPLVGVVACESKNALVAAGEDGDLRVWPLEADKDPVSPVEKPKLLKDHTGMITALTANAERFATASRDKIHVWEVPADKPGRQLKAPTVVRGLALSSDGKTLASVGDDKAVQLWTLADGKPTRKLTGPTDWLLTACFAPDGKLVVAAGQDGKLWGWDAESGAKKFEVLADQPPAKKVDDQPKNVVSSLAISPDGKTLLVGGSDAKVHVFQATDGKYLRSLGGHTSTVTGLVFHPAGNFALSSSKDRTVRLWQPATGAMLKSLEGHGAWAEGVALIHKGTKALTASADRTVRLWDLGAPPVKKDKK